jgi:hypothetical protein
MSAPPTQPPRRVVVRVMVAGERPIVAGLAYLPTPGETIRLGVGDPWRVDTVTIEHGGTIAATILVSPCASE